MTWDARTWRNNLRLTSGLVLLSFVICHLLAHSLLIVSLDAANVAFDVTMYVWRTEIGTALLLAAFVVHYANALWSIYVRQSLRLAPWQWTQLALGLCIPLLILSHVMGTVVADKALGAVGSYQSVLIAHWVAAPRRARSAITSSASALSVNPVKPRRSRHPERDSVARRVARRRNGGDAGRDLRARLEAGNVPGDILIVGVTDVSALLA